MKKLSPEQQFFILAKKVIEHYSEIKKERELSPAEHNIYMQRFNDCWLMVKLYALSLINERCKTYKKSNDYREELLQECALKFSKHFQAYDPYRTTPTTYFSYRFQECITQYLRKNSQNLSQNDANNLAKIKKVIRKYEQMNIVPNMEILMRETGLSAKVISNTLRYSSTSQYASIEDAYDLADKGLTPEQELLAKEKNRALRKALKLLTPEEKEFLFYKMNISINDDGFFNEGKERNYADLEKHFGLQPSEVKTLNSTIIAKLANAKELQSYNPNRTQYLDEPMLELDEDVSSILDEIKEIISSDDFDSAIHQ